ncbi:MAG: hypothetical protein VXZ92_12800 [SAR324 cluster bacterium]|nr:hypothetical protein [SAR324 cluster bacterium]
MKDIENIGKYFEIKPEGNWENKIILVQKEKPTEEILKKLFQIRSLRKKPFFDDKTQLDLNCLWLSSLVKAHEVLPNKGYFKLAEEFFLKIEKKSWIIDCFKENNYPLEIAEIEISNEEEDLSLPSFISKEITGLTHYSNFSLANNPFSEWKEDYLTTFKSK